MLGGNLLQLRLFATCSTKKVIIRTLEKEYFIVYDTYSSSKDYTFENLISFQLAHCTKSLSKQICALIY